MRDILNDEKVTQSIYVSTSQPKISLYFTKKIQTKTIRNKLIPKNNNVILVNDFLDMVGVDGG